MNTPSLKFAIGRKGCQAGRTRCSTRFSRISQNGRRAAVFRRRLYAGRDGARRFAGSPGSRGGARPQGGDRAIDCGCPCPSRRTSAGRKRARDCPSSRGGDGSHAGAWRPRLRRGGRRSGEKADRFTKRIFFPPAKPRACSFVVLAVAGGRSPPASRGSDFLAWWEWLSRGRCLACAFGASALRRAGRGKAVPPKLPRGGAAFLCRSVDAR